MSTSVLVDPLRVRASSSSSSGTSVSPLGVARVHIFGRTEAGWRIGQPLPVTVHRRGDGSYLATDDVFGVFGEGDSWDEAEGDLVASLIDTFLLTAEGADEPTQALVQHFRTYIHPIQP